jgi:AraC family transcriptional regulator
MGSRHDSICAHDFRGIDVYSQDWGGVVLHASMFKPDARIEEHTHTHAYACFLANGILCERTKTYTSRYMPHTLILYPPGEDHADSFEGYGFCIDMQFSSAWMKEILGDNCWVTERQAFDCGPMLCAGLRLFHLFLNRTLLTVLEVEEFAVEVLGRSRSAGRLPKHRPSWIPALIEQMEAELTVPRSLSQWAQLVGVHPIYLARAFRKALGTSLGEFQRLAKIRRAVRLLTHSTLPIVDIAYKSGFTDQSHLTHLVSRYTRFTPAALRRSFNGLALEVPGVQD